MAASTTNETFMQKYGNVITIGLWVVALSSHAILIPKFIKAFKEDKAA